MLVALLWVRLKVFQSSGPKWEATLSITSSGRSSKGLPDALRGVREEAAKTSSDINNFILGPTPNENLNVEIHYFYRPTSLTAGAGAGTTWLSENAELTLLYGSLIEAYIFMKGESDILQMYDKRFQESLVGLKLFGESKENTQDYRVGRVNLPKQ